MKDWIGIAIDKLFLIFKGTIHQEAIYFPKHPVGCRQNMALHGIFKRANFLQEMALIRIQAISARYEKNIERSWDGLR